MPKIKVKSLTVQTGERPQTNGRYQTYYRHLALYLLMHCFYMPCHFEQMKYVCMYVLRSTGIAVVECALEFLGHIGLG